jgi:hypothetical protein
MGYKIVSWVRYYKNQRTARKASPFRPSRWSSTLRRRGDQNCGLTKLAQTCLTACPSVAEMVPIRAINSDCFKQSSRDKRTVDQQYPIQEQFGRGLQLVLHLPADCFTRPRRFTPEVLDVLPFHPGFPAYPGKVPLPFIRSTPLR